ncbi:hypothetical protein BKA70DRAFT_1476507 [Coprinopsis sp. MPI-PUGE-AT-0042]|nr:hypothetical protein BKA70DRAFT_1476507 [Coprinopsis sp. MPI-PUGE-AT-0042]
MSNTCLFFNTQLGNYCACLLAAMMVNSAAGMVGVPWLINKGITEGLLCTIQGFLMQLATWSGAYFTVSIAIHTFNSLVLKRNQSAIVSRSAMTVGWGLSALMASLPFVFKKTDGDIYGPEGLMCTIRSVYPRVQFFLHLMPILVASILSAVFYSIIFLVLRGTISIKGGIKLTLDPNQRFATSERDGYHRFIARIARSMIWYPIAYVALLVPYSVMKLLSISGFVPSRSKLSFSGSVAGVVNVGLFYNTFRVLEPALDGSPSLGGRRDLESAEKKDDVKDFPPHMQLTDPEKADRFYGPMPTYNRSPSVQSDERQLLSHDKTPSQDSLRSYNYTLSSPSAALQKAEVLAHAPNSSISSSQGQYSPTQHFRRPLPSSAIGQGHVLSRQPTFEAYTPPASANVAVGHWPSASWSSSTGGFETVTPLRPSPNEYHGPASARTPPRTPRELSGTASPISPQRIGWLWQVPQRTGRARGTSAHDARTAQL